MAFAWRLGICNKKMLKTAFFQGLLLISTWLLSTDSCSGIREGKLDFATCGLVQGTIALSSLRISSEMQMSGSNHRCKRIDSEILVEVLRKANCYLFIFLCITHMCVITYLHTHACMGAHESVCGGHNLTGSVYLSHFLLHGLGKKIGSSRWARSSLIQLDWLTNTSQGSFFSFSLSFFIKNNNSLFEEHSQ